MRGGLQKWTDYKLSWDPMEYGGVEMLYVPSEHIWLPDIVLFNKYVLESKITTHAIYILLEFSFKICKLIMCDVTV